MKAQAQTKYVISFLFFIVLIFSHFHVIYAKTMQERPLVMVIPSYNNKAWFKKNLDSVFCQNYKNYRVIYIDDCSTDGTYELVKQYIQQHDQMDRVTLIRNQQRRGALANHYKAGHLCKNNEIIIQLDADDWLPNEHVLERVNEAYADPDVWMTYGQHEVYPSKKSGQCKEVSPGIIRKVAYRESRWITSALRTFYAGLFKQIKLQDLIHQGEFFSTTCDFAFMLPMLEMADGRIKFINEVLYIYNCKTTENDYKKHLQLQLHTEYIIRSRRKCQPLDKLPQDGVKNRNMRADISVFSQNNPTGLRVLLTSIYGCMSGIGTIAVLYEATDEDVTRAYGELTECFPDVGWVNVDNKQDFKAALSDFVARCPSEYLLFAHDTTIVKDFIDLSRCIQCMEKSGAYSFSLALGNNIMYSQSLQRKQKQPLMLWYQDDVYAWQFKDGEYDWASPHSTAMTMYRKKDIQPAIADMCYNSPQTFSVCFRNYPFDQDAVGLFFQQSKVIDLVSLKTIDPLEFFRVPNTMIMDKGVPVGTH